MSAKPFLMPSRFAVRAAAILLAWPWVIAPKRPGLPLPGMPEGAVAASPRPTPPPESVGGLPALPLSQDVLWQQTAAEPEFAAFQQWARHFGGATGDPADGVNLATARRAALKALIARDPQRALELAVPEAVRRAMPPEVQALLEEKVDARGDLIVLARSPSLAGERMTGPAVTRGVTLADGRRLEAFTYGRREFQPSRQDIPLHGIAVEGKLALSEWPGRVLEPVELADAKAALTGAPVCPTSKQPTESTGTETAILTASEPVIYCRPGHALNELRLAADKESRRPPGLGGSSDPLVAASGGSGQPVPTTIARGNSAWTTGIKRICVVRVTFAGQAYQNFSQADCEQMLQDLSVAWLGWSGGRCFVMPSQPLAGSYISPVLHLSRTAAAFPDTQEGHYDLWNAAGVFAGEQGRHRSSYDFLYVIAGPAPFPDPEGGTVTWGGIGEIGGSDGTGSSINRASDYANLVRVGLHELGHNLGLYHSSSLTRNTGSNVDVFDEYGDPHCRMGSGDVAYNARYKHWLHWLDDVNMPAATTSGEYTVLAHDQGETSGVRVLQVPYAELDSGNSLFVEYRAEPRFAGDEWVEIQVQEGPNDAAKLSWLEVPDSSVNGVPPGLTLSRSAQGQTLHVTNLGADPATGRARVYVHRGTPAGNHAPVVTINSSTPSAAPGQPVLFVANATDADGDALAYDWDTNHFPSIPFDKLNQSAIITAFPSTFTVRVTCTVSDMRGGVTTATLDYPVAVNEPPTITAIGAQTINEDGALAGGIPFTVSDTITPAASLTVTAASDNPVLFPPGSLSISSQAGGNRRVHGVAAANQSGEATVTLTVSDGTFSSVEQFRITVLPTTPGTVLSAAGATWRYRDAIAAPGANWKNSNFNDSGWSQGAVRFVYHQGANAGTTTLSTPSSARAACYFRRQFTVPIIMTNTLTLRFICDDGAVFYANGTEIYRHNMPAGTPAHTTNADRSVEGADEKAWVIIPLANSVLNPGATNTLAVEVHDSGRHGDGDVTFDCELGMLSAPVIGTINDKVSLEDVAIGPHSFTAADFESPPGVLTFSATSSNQALIHDSSLRFGTAGGTGNPTISMTPVRNGNGTSVITISVSDGSSVAQRSFTQTVLALNDPPVIAPLPDMAAALGELVPVVTVNTSDVDSALTGLTFSASSFNTALVPAAGVTLIPTGIAGQRWLRLVPVNGATGETTITVTANDGQFPGAETFLLRIAAPQTIAGTDIRLADAGERWSYWVNAAPAGWAATSFDDSAWPGGRGRLGYGGDGEVTAVPATPYRMTTYFRRTFRCPTRAAVADLKVRLQRDDGVVIYLNGTELLRSNMPGGAITASTPASAAVEGSAAEQLWSNFPLPATDLVNGTNTLAAEVHQRTLPTAAAPGDLGFDLELTATPAAETYPDVIVPAGDAWHFWDGQSYPDENWVRTNFIENGWKEGTARIGYGIAGGSTVALSLNAAASGRNPSVLFRKVFDVAWPEAYRFLHLHLQRDDGAIVYLNGVRVLLDNVAGSATPNDFAVSETPDTDVLLWRHYLLSPGQLLAGRNLLAVAVHQSAAADTDLTFDLQLTGVLSVDEPPPFFITPEDDGRILSWPAAWNGWQAEGSTNLAAASWSVLPGPVLSLAGWNYLALQGVHTRRFFRLRRL